jgi:hypothetical protein
MLNNRELATAIWVVAFAIWAVRKRELRTAASEVLRLLGESKMIVLLTMLTAYALGEVFLLRTWRVWTPALLKDTILWLLIGPLPMVVRFTQLDESEDMLKQVFSHSVKLVIVLEFLLNVFTFSFTMELLIVPLILLAAMIESVSEYDGHPGITRVAKGFQILFGVVVLANLTYRVILEYQSLANYDTLRSIALVPLLSILFSPFMYFVALMSTYELVFLRLDFGARKSVSLKHYAKWHIVRFAGVGLRRLQLLQRNHLVELLQLQSREDVDALLDSARFSEKSESRSQ